MSEEEKIPPEEIPQEQPDENTSSAELIAEAEQQQTTNSSTEALAQAENKPQTEEDMEVHHHTHPAHGKKNWKSYFWEFLMLFLAVFCGFLAEYFLEHKIEKERGKQYLLSLYEDLKADTSRISFYTNYDEEKIRSLDNLRNCYDTVSKNMNETSCLLDVIKNTAINRPFIRTDRTLKQLANAGGFRLLRKDDADSILSYDKDFNNFQDFQGTVFQEAQDNVRNTFNMLVNFNANAQMFTPKAGMIITRFNNEEVTAPLMFSANKDLLNKYFNELLLYYRVTYNHKRMLLDLKEKQIQLIRHFKTKYHFE